MSDERKQSINPTPGHFVYDDAVFCEVFPKEVLDKIKQFGFRDSDLIVATYPKCGTTWMQEIVYLVVTKGDFASAAKSPLDDRFPFIEMSNKQQGTYINEIETRPDPRLIKTHLYSHFFKNALEKKKTKFIVVMRNPKDALVSYYHFYRMNIVLGGDGGYKGSWDDFFENLVKPNLLVHGSWWHHVSDWWQYKDNPNVEFFKYEDMKTDPKANVKKVAAFLGIDLADAIIDKIVDHTSFQSMKNNKMTNKSEFKVMDSNISPFMRKGAVGDWTNYFSETQSKYVDDIVSKYLDGSGLSFTE